MDDQSFPSWLPLAYVGIIFALYFGTVIVASLKCQTRKEIEANVFNGATIMLCIFWPLGIAVGILILILSGIEKVSDMLIGWIVRLRGIE